LAELKHLSMETLTGGLDEVRRSPATTGVLELIVRRPRPDVREVVESAELDVVEGLVGDRWRTRGSAELERQLTVTNARLMALVAQEKRHWPPAGDQLYVDFDLSADNAPAGTRMSIGEAVIEVTETPHTGCRKFAARYGLDALKFISTPVGQHLRLRGVNARVVRSGTIRAGDTVRKL
jgi:MOSC domain-containing protein YiiM